MTKFTLFLIILLLSAVLSSCSDKADESNSIGTINERVSYLESKIKSLETRYDILARRSLEKPIEKKVPDKNLESKTPPADTADEKSPVIENVSMILDEGFNDDAYIGSSNPSVSVIIYSDLSCEKCVEYLSELIPSLRSKYKNNLKVQARLRDFPLDKYPNSNFLAEASHCVGEQGNYWNFLESLLKNKPTSKDDILKIAKEPLIKLKDQPTLSRCLNSKKYEKEVALDKNSGIKIGVIGVPSVFIGLKIAEKEFKGALIRGNQDISIIHKYIEHLLEKNE